MAIPSYAAARYAATTSLTPFQPSSAVTGTDLPQFGDLVQNSLARVAEKGLLADQQVASVAAGQADMVSVVTAVAESESAIETLVAVRDKVIAAYDDIMRMQV
ncbi:MAG: flagellar hook-basal body complex protein FliE [Hyphomicrobiales bacterium]